MCSPDLHGVVPDLGADFDVADLCLDVADLGPEVDVSDLGPDVDVIDP